MNPNTFMLTSDRKPTIDVTQMRKNDNQKMFQFLPVLRNQSQFSNASYMGFVPNREMNTILDQAKLNSIINDRDGTRVYPSGSYNFNFFPTNR